MKDDARPAPWHRHAHWLFLLLVLLLLGAQMLFELHQSRLRSEATASSRLENHNRVLFEDLNRQIVLIDKVLRQMRDHLPATAGRQSARPDLSQELAEWTGMLESVRTLAVFDAAGTVIACNRPEIIGQNFAQREYFRQMEAQPLPDRVHVPHPFTTALGVYTLNLVRPRYGPQGEFAGIVSATLDVDDLGKLMRSLHAGENTRLSITHDSGLLLKMIPEREDIPPGRNLNQPNSLFAQHIASARPANLFSGMSLSIGTESVASLRTLRLTEPLMDHGLIIVTARDLADIRADWMVRRNNRYLGFALLALFAILGVALYHRYKRRLEAQIATQEDRRQHAEQELKESVGHLRELNNRLETAQNQLLQSEKMASIGQLAAGVAHELNNPIGFVHSNLATLDQYLKDIFEIAAVCEEASRKTGSPAEFAAIEAIKLQKDFAYIRSDVFQLVRESREGLERVTKIVRDLKDFSRAGEAEWQWANLHAGLDSTLNIVWNELKYKCTVTKEYGELPSVWCVPAQLNQVFMNLLINAGHAIADKGDIVIRTGQRNHEVFVAIADSGCGIPPENLNRLFEPFFTTKPVGKGTGLGLSLAYSIVQKHHGRIEVVSEVGQGATFTVWLPIESTEPPAADGTSDLT